MKNEQENTQALGFDIKQELIEWGYTIVATFAIAYIITSIVSTSLVIGQSMYPTFSDRDYLVVNRVAYLRELPREDDIILFKSTLPDERVLIKRTIAKEGDELVIQDSNVYVNGVKLEEDYLNEKNFYGDVKMVIPAGKVFVMGDNRNSSLDSREESVGLIDESQIVGKVFFRILPINSAGRTSQL